jgi:flagellar biosynthetic protein FliR
MDYTAAGAHDLYTFLLVFARISAAVVTAPPLSTRAAPSTVKAGFALLFSLALVPGAVPLVGAVPVSLIGLALVVGKNVLIGLAIGFIAQILFACVQIGGQVADTQMGFGFMNLVNPFSQQQSSVMSTFLQQMALTLYLLANGHLVLLGAMRESFQSLALGIGGHGVVAQSVGAVVQSTCVLGLRIALPTIGILLTTDIALGLVARTVPQINVFIVGAPAKILVGMATMILILPVMALIVGQIVAGTSFGLHALVAGAK